MNNKRLKMSYNEYIANANTAFGSGAFSTSLKYAELAIKGEPKETDGYKWSEAI